jgi:hypothetical protein
MLRVSITILPSECGLVLGDRDRDPDYGKRGIRTPGGGFPPRRFSKPVHSASLSSFQICVSSHKMQGR